MLAFGGTRTHHRLMCEIEDAGFEIRDVIMWVHGEGFPKGSNLKPSWEPIIVCRKKGKGKLNINDSRVPCSEEDEKKNEYYRTKPRPGGTGFGDKYIGATKGTASQHISNGKLNIEETRVPCSEADIEFIKVRHKNAGFASDGYIGGKAANRSNDLVAPEGTNNGRHPANLIHDGSDQVMNLFPQTSATFRGHYEGKGGCFGGGRIDENNAYTDEGSAARYFYCAKPSPGERETANGHPTIKPLKLMRYLVKLISYEGELVLDPFMGSGSSIIAARLESRNAIGIDLDQAYCDTALERCEAAMGGTLIDVFE